MNQPHKWYQNNAAIVLFLILIFPIGLYLMWKYGTWSSKTKWIITGIVFSIIIIGGVTNNSEKKIPQTNQVNKQGSVVATSKPVQATLIPSPQPTRDPSKITYDDAKKALFLAGFGYKLNLEKVENMDKYIEFIDNGTGNIDLFGTKNNITMIRIDLNNSSIDKHLVDLPSLLDEIVQDKGVAKIWLVTQIQSFLTTQGEYFEETSLYFHEAKKVFDNKDVWIMYSKSSTSDYKTSTLEIKIK